MTECTEKLFTFVRTLNKEILKMIYYWDRVGSVLQRVFFESKSLYNIFPCTFVVNFNLDSSSLKKSHLLP